MGLRPKKSLGQHFLLDLDAAQRIVDALKPINPDLVIEIGPGEGVLTKRMMDVYGSLHLIEVDNDSVDHLRSEYPQLTDRLIHADFLHWKVPEGDWTIIGNFPYNISSQIVFRMIEHKASFKALVGMFQKEVAERIVAPPGSKVYGILSVITQAFYDGEYLFTVDEAAFRPPPKVKSGVIRLIRKSDFKIDCDERFFFSLVKTTFNQRRKMLRNTLKPFLNEENTHLVDAYLTMRPEQLGYKDFIKLSRLLKP